MHQVSFLATVLSRAQEGCSLLLLDCIHVTQDVALPEGLDSRQRLID